MAGNRVRKVTDNYSATGTPTRKSQRLYLGTEERYRTYSGGTTTELVTVHIQDDKGRFALHERTSSSAWRIRYTHADLLESSPS